MRNSFSLLLFSVAFIFCAFAQAASNQSIVYQGRILRPDGSTLNSGVIAFSLNVYSPAPSRCLLYSETQSLNMSGSAGMFSLALGAGTRTDGGAHAFNKIFVNGGTLSGLTCASGTSYSPASTDDRVLEATFNDGGTAVNLSAMSIKSIPFALQAQEIAGYGVNDIVKIHPTTGSATTFTTAEMAKVKLLSAVPTCATNEILKWNGTAWICSTDVSGGSPTDATYAAKGVIQLDTNAATSGLSVASGVVKLSDVNSNVGTFGSATKTVTFTVNAQGRITAASEADIALPPAQITQSGANTGEVLKWNGTAWAPAADAGTTTDASYAAKGIVQFDTNAATSGVSVTSGVAKVNFGTGANQIVKLDASGRLPAVDGSQLTNLPTSSFTGTLPPGSGGTGQSSYTAGDLLYATGATATAKLGIGASGTVLTSTGTAPQWSTVSSLGFIANGGNSFTADATIGTNDAYKLNFETNNVSRLSIDENGQFGAGTAPIATTQFGLSKSYTNSGTTTSNIGIQVSTNHEPGAATSNTTYGVRSTATFKPSVGGANTSGGVVGVYGEARNESFSAGTAAYMAGGHFIGGNGWSTATDVYGVNSLAQIATMTTNAYGSHSQTNINTASGISGAAYGSYSKVYHPGMNVVVGNAYGTFGRVETDRTTATINTARGGYFDVVKTQGTIDTGYGVYIGPVAGTVNYGLYQSTAGNQNYFAGNVGIGSGTSTPSSALDLGGDLTWRGMAAPSVSAAGQGRIYFDTVAGKFKVSESGGAYVDLVGGGGGGGVTGVTAGTGLLVGTTAGGTISTTGTLNINVGTGANQIVQLDGSGRLPAVDGSALTNLSAANITAGTLPVGRGGTGLTAGTSGGIPYYSAANTMASSAALTANGVLLGGGAGAAPTATAAGAAYSVLRVPSGGGAPVFGAIDLSQSAAVTGTLAIGNGGTGVTSFGVDRLVATTGAGALTTVNCAQNQVLSFNASGVYGCYNVGSIFNGFVNGGNTVTATAALGTDSNHNLEFETNGTSKMAITAAGNVGIGILAPTSLFHVKSDPTVTSGSVVMMKGDLNVSPSAASSANYRGLSVTASRYNTTFDVTGTLTGVNGYAANDTAGAVNKTVGGDFGAGNSGVAMPITTAIGVKGSTSVFGTSTDVIAGDFFSERLGGASTTTNLIGIRNRINSDAGTSTNIYGMQTEVSANGAGGSTNAYGSKITMSQSGGAVTNFYGLYLDPITHTVAPTLKYGVYQAGANDSNYFAGNVGIGIAPTNDKLQVGGTLRVTGEVIVDDDDSTSRMTFAQQNVQLYGSPSLYLAASQNYTHPNGLDPLGTIAFLNNTSWNQAAKIMGLASENHGNTATGGKLLFYTTPNTTATPLERVVIDQDGSVGIGLGADGDPTHLFHVNGTIRYSASIETTAASANSGALYTIPDMSKNLVKIVLTDNTTIALPTPTGMEPDTVYTLTVRVSQDGVGTRTVAWSSGANAIDWDGGGAAPPAATGAGADTIYRFIFFSGEATWYASRVWSQN